MSEQIETDDRPTIELKDLVGRLNIDGKKLTLQEAAYLERAIEMRRRLIDAAKRHDIKLIRKIIEMDTKVAQDVLIQEFIAFHGEDNG